MKCFFDNDLYKFSMARAIEEHYPDAVVSYKFIDREKRAFTPFFLKHLKRSITEMCMVKPNAGDCDWLLEQCPWLGKDYIEKLKTYSLNRDEVELGLNDNNQLYITINGPWWRTVYWEVPLMALVSKIYYHFFETNWNYNVVEETTKKKIKLLEEAGVMFADFGTRRRRDNWTHNIVLNTLRNSKSCVGTSNVYFAKNLKMKPIGTCAHEWFMGVYALSDKKRANAVALTKWMEVYGENNCGVALADTYGVESFLNDFDSTLANAYDGVRQDSGDPFAFADKIVEHYERLGINPQEKVIVFSDSLSAELAVRLKQYCDGRIKTSFGIGTNLTNDFPNSKPLNIVIKLDEVNGVKVAKLSDDKNKASGDPEAIAEAIKIHGV